jgi:hypothetical protein
VRALAELSLRRPVAALTLLAAATLGLAAGMPRLATDVGYRAYLGAGHPAIRELDAFAARFGGGYPFAAIFCCDEAAPCRSVFDPVSLRMAHEVATRLAEVPGVRRVDGPATSPLLVPVPLDLPEARRLAPGGEPARDLARLAARAVEDPVWVGQLVSADAKAGALLVHLASTDGATSARAVGRLRELLAPWEARGFRFALVGGPVEFVVAGAELEADARRLLPVMVGLVALVVVALFRSGAAALFSLASVGLAVVWTRGLQGWLGWPQSSLTEVLPPLLLVIGVCDAVHPLSSYAVRAAREGAETRGEREAVMRGVVAEVGWPCFVTSATTAAGFASFVTSHLESFVRFGWIAAFGVMAALFLSFTLLPLAVVRVPARWVAPAGKGRGLDRALLAAWRLARRRPRAILAAAAVSAALGIGGWASLSVEATFEHLYGEESRVVRWARDASRLLREPETLEIAVEPPPGLEPGSAEALRVLARVERAAAVAGLGRELSILDPLRELHRLVHRGPLDLEGNGAAARARSLLRLLRFEEPEVVDLFLERERGALRLSVQAGKLPQGRLRAVLSEVRARVAGALPPGWRAEVTGPLAVVGAMIDEIRATQLQSFAQIGIVVFALLAVLFRSLRLAAFGLVPAVLPVVWTLGAMGLLGIPLDVGSAMVAAVVVGLVDDYAIHLLAAYRRHRARGEAGEAAIAGALEDEGRAVATTALALAAGFLALGLAPWQSIASFGLVAAVAILHAMAAALLVLPAALVAATRRGWVP